MGHDALCGVVPYCYETGNLSPSLNFIKMQKISHLKMKQWAFGLYVFMGTQENGIFSMIPF
jgi:hypothetical protein